MHWWDALILGIVEGITEYLPVSSTGHLLLTQRAFGIGQSEAADAFAISIQAGAILAVLGLYRARVFQMLRGLGGKDEAGRRLLINVVVGFLPALAAGLVLEKPIKKYLFGGDALGLWPIVAAWFVGGVAILATSWYRSRRRSTVGVGREVTDLAWQQALIIGAFQCIAMWPGTSRSLVTIVAGILVGLRLSAAVEFSFLLGVVTLSAVTAHDTLKYGKVMLETFGLGNLSIGFVAAWLSAALAVRWMVTYLNKHGLGIFGWYRIGLALVVAAAIYAGWLNPVPA